MRILIDVGHPAHVHYYKNFTLLMCENGNEVLFTCRNKKIIIDLLDYYNLKYVKLGNPFTSVFGKLFGLLYFTFRVFFVCLKFKPDIVINATMYSAIASWLINKPHISLEDTFNQEQVKLYMPFTDVVITGDYNHPPLGEKEISISGYQELMYLHPKRFTPDKNIFYELGLSEGEKYIVMRFSNWKASHDIGHKGISLENKMIAVKEFSKYCRVFISAEGAIENELIKYQLKTPPNKIHDVLAFASFLWAESFTMPAECSILGTPSIINHNSTSYYLIDQEKNYGLCFLFSESEYDQKKAIDKGIELLRSKGLKENWSFRKEKMLSEKIDVTAFMVWFIENYPRSKKIMKENPDYQYNFK